MSGMILGIILGAIAFIGTIIIFNKKDANAKV